MNWHNPVKYVWTDTTSYTRSKPREEQPATCWTIYFEAFRLSVWKSRHADLGYLCTAHGFIEFGEHQLRSVSDEEARSEAMDFIQNRIDIAYQEMAENRSKVKP